MQYLASGIAADVLCLRYTKITVLVENKRSDSVDRKLEANFELFLTNRNGAHFVGRAIFLVSMGTRSPFDPLLDQSLIRLSTLPRPLP